VDIYILFHEFGFEWLQISLTGPVIRVSEIPKALQYNSELIFGVVHV